MVAGQIARGSGMIGMLHENMFLEKQPIDGDTVSFQVMPASEGMRHGGSHHFMVKVEKKARSSRSGNFIVSLRARRMPSGQDRDRPFAAML